MSGNKCDDKNITTIKLETGHAHKKANSFTADLSPSINKLKCAQDQANHRHTEKTDCVVKTTSKKPLLRQSSATSLTQV